jgi:diguanylate cyclase (GGDEF)-like protein
MTINNPDIIFDTLDNGIIILDEDLNVVYWNKWLDIKTKISSEDIVNQNFCKRFPNVKEKTLKRKIKTTLTLNAASYYSVEPHKYLIDIKLHNITNKIYTSMRQRVTIVPYDIEKKQVCLYVYDQTAQSEMNFKLNNTLKQLEKYKIELETKVEEGLHRVYHDPLTKVYNRAKIEEVIIDELKRHKRHKEKFCLVIVDIDHFKIFNDTYGHLIGDDILISLANACNKTIRTTDIFARWGGEEFLVLLPNTDIKSTVTVVKNLQQAIASIQHKTAGSVTASFGITEAKENDTVDSMFQRADEALYIAKENGRNRYEIN